MDEIDRRVARSALKVISVSFVFVAVGPPLGFLVYSLFAPAAFLHYFAAGMVLSYIAGFVPAAFSGVIYSLLPRDKRVTSRTAAFVGGVISCGFTSTAVATWGLTINIQTWSLVGLPILQFTCAGAVAAALCSRIVASIGAHLRASGWIGSAA